mgnify:CR=1 FL=1
MNRKKRVLLRAPLLTISGYGVHSRQIFDYLSRRSDIDLTVQLLSWGHTSWMIESSLEDGMIGKIMMCSKEIKAPYDLSVQVQLPDEWDHKLAHKNIGISAFVETDVCNKTWIDRCNLMTKVIVPSTFITKTIQRTALLTTPVAVVPEHFNSNITKSEKCDLTLSRKFNFLILGQLTGNTIETDRKNTMNMIKWTCETFSDNPQVGIVLKTNVGRTTLRDRSVTIETIKNVLKQVRTGLHPKVELVHGNMSSKEIAGLYNHDRIKCLLSATHGEGFGLPLIDAASAGMPIIATGWSGHMEFLEKEYISSLKYTLGPIPEARVDNRIFMKGARWAYVDEKEFKKKLLDVYRNYKGKKSKAKKLQNKIINNFSKSAVFKIYDEAFDNLI